MRIIGWNVFIYKQFIWFFPDCVFGNTDNWFHGNKFGSNSELMLRINDVPF